MATPTILPQEPQLDFIWILSHHNKQLIAPIRLQMHSQMTEFIESVKNWQPWRAAGGNPKSGWERPDKENSFRISIVELHRIRLRKLQCKLVNHAWYMKRFNREPDGWEDDLQEYTKALQDYDYMTKCSTAQHDSFLVSGESKADAYVMREVVGVHLTGDATTPIPVVGPWEEENQPIGGMRNENVERSWIRAFKRRLVMAALGGTFLVGPMWLMVLHNNMYTALVSTTVFVYAFGFFMSMLLDSPMEVLGGMAAYAAVLVVLVGLGPGNGSPSSPDGGGSGSN